MSTFSPLFQHSKRGILIINKPDKGIGLLNEGLTRKRHDFLRYYIKQL